MCISITQGNDLIQGPPTVENEVGFLTWVSFGRQIEEIV